MLKPKTQKSDYRPAVGLVIFNDQGEVFLGRRRRQRGFWVWQFPQGGIDAGETALEALHREVLEEVGLPSDSYDIVEQRDGYRYDFPPEKVDKKGYDGQEQTYFLCQLRKGAPEPNTDYDAKEFQGYKWIKKKKFKRKWVPRFKREVYEQVMLDFFKKDLRD